MYVCLSVSQRFCHFNCLFVIVLFDCLPRIKYKKKCNFIVHLHTHTVRKLHQNMTKCVNKYNHFVGHIPVKPTDNAGWSFCYRTTQCFYRFALIIWMRAVRSCHITHLHSNKCVCVCVLNMFSYLILRIWCGYFCANSISYINAIYRTCNIIVQLFFFLYSLARCVNYLFLVEPFRCMGWCVFEYVTWFVCRQTALLRCGHAKMVWPYRL